MSANRSHTTVTSRYGSSTSQQVQRWMDANCFEAMVQDLRLRLARNY